MAPHVQVMLSGALTFGAPLAIAIRELFVLRRRRPGGWPDGPGPEPVVPGTPRGDSDARPRLPACLLVPERPFVPSRARVLDPV